MVESSSDEEIPKGMPQPGEVFATKFQIERVLGAGGMGVVYAAKHLHLDQLVALKLIRPECAEPEFLARFLREGRAMVKIRSEHVAKVFDVGSDGRGISYLVMEHLEGSDLGDAGGKLPIPVVVDYVVQACDALAHAHAQGIVHRDIKPSNLFAATNVENGPIVKVLDFGIAKAPAVEEAAANQFVLTQTGGIMGSPMYMSPEQVRASREVDARADIWSLGVVLFELISGKGPFEGASLAALAASIVVDPPRSLAELKPDTPPELVDVVLRCLEKRPADRHASVADLALALAPFGTDETMARAERVGRVVPPSERRLPTSAPVSPPAIAVAPPSSRRDRPRGRTTFFKKPQVVAIATAAAMVAIAGVVLAAIALGGPRAEPKGLAATTSAAPVASLPLMRSTIPEPPSSMSAASDPTPPAPATVEKKTTPAPTGSARRVSPVRPAASAPGTAPAQAPSSGLVHDRHGS